MDHFRKMVKEGKMSQGEVNNKVFVPHRRGLCKLRFQEEGASPDGTFSSKWMQNMKARSRAKALNRCKHFKDPEVDWLSFKDPKKSYWKLPEKEEYKKLTKPALDYPRIGISGDNSCGSHLQFKRIKKISEQEDKNQTGPEADPCPKRELDAVFDSDKSEEASQMGDLNANFTMKENSRKSDEKVMQACLSGDLSSLHPTDLFMPEDDQSSLASFHSATSCEVEASPSTTSSVMSTEFNGSCPNCSSPSGDSLVESPTTSEEGPSALQSKEILRDYQLALYEIAKSQNIIACLPTGSGKTLIAIKLMTFYRDSVINEGKKIVFVANTVPLLRQQADVISRCTRYTVQMVYGGNKNQWKDWKTTMETAQVLVMIPAIFLDRIDHGHLKFKDICLLVLDECHHALKHNPVRILMKNYQEMKQKNLYDMPRVLGLSATIVKQNLKHSVEDAVKSVEDTLCCTAITYEAFERVLKFSTNADIRLEAYEENPHPEWENFIGLLNKAESVVTRTLGDLQTDAFGGKSMEAIMIALDHLKKDQAIFKDMLNAITDIKSVFTEVGPFGAMVVALIKYEYFIKVNNKALPALLKHFFLTSLRTFMFAIQKFVIKSSGPEFTACCSFKVLHLLSLLEKNINGMCGIVFVGRRGEAHALGAYLQELQIQQPEKWGFLKTGIIVGANNTNTEPPQYRQSNNKHGEIIRQFQRGSVNLIIATSILEEGIDVQSCGFVVRFDKVLSYPSFVQSMGRARKPGAKYYMMVSSNPKTHSQAVELVEKFTSLKHQINENLQQQMNLIRTALDNCPRGEGPVSDVDRRFQDYIAESDPVFCPGGTPESPKVTMYSAIGLVNHYVALLKANHESEAKLEDFKPLCVTRAVDCDEDDPENGLYYAIVMMPRASVVKELTTGPTTVGQANAKKAAFLQVVRKLHVAGALDSNLVPTRPRPSTGSMK